MTAVLDMAAATHRGRLRLQNEDCVAADAAIGLAVLADGMGGHNAGEVASRMAVDVITAGIQASVKKAAGQHTRASAESLIANHISQANQRIYEAGQARGEYSGMGTTVVVAFWHERSVSVGHVGDSRMYRLRARELKQLTHDHSLAQEHVDLGLLSSEEARTAPIRSVLTRTVGNGSQVTAELNTFPVAADDLYLLCSDGLTDMLTDEQISEALISFGTTIQNAADQLIAQANHHGGVDNVSVILARILNGKRRGSQ
jgi:serine/threonine protein phosphatase PrpC